MSQKLESFAKILLATGQINYMAASLEGVTKDYRILASGVAKSEKFIKVGLAEKEKMLRKVSDQLNKTMEMLADFLNNRDCICQIDVRVSRAPFEILLNGMDDNEKEYDDEWYSIQNRK